MIQTLKKHQRPTASNSVGDYLFLQKIILFILTLIFTKLSWSAERFVKTYYDHNRTFYVSDLQEGKWIKTSQFQIFLFNEASHTCNLSKNKIQKEFSNLNVSFWKILNQYYPNAEKKILSLNLKISIDSFGSKKQHPDFASFFLPQMPTPDDNIIAIECRYFHGNYWKALLGHELMHALLALNGVSSWTEELLAQNVEYEISRQWPSLRMNTLAEKVLVPSPITEERPFLSSARYASNFLLGQYLLKRWGGLSALRAFLPQVPVPQCSTDFTDISILCRIRQFLIQMKSTPELQERSTVPGLLRHFAVALVLNKSYMGSQDLYSIPDWQGFSSTPLSNERTIDLNKINLEKGAFLRLHPKLWQHHQTQWNPQLEIYRIISYKDGSYEIRTRDHIQNKLLKNTLKDTVILLNTSSESPLSVF